MLTQCLEDKWRAFFVGEQKNFWRGDVLLGESLMVVRGDLNGLVLDESTSQLFQVFWIEFVVLHHEVHLWDWVRGVDLHGWERGNFFLLANFGEITAINGSNSEDTLVVLGKLVVVVDHFLAHWIITLVEVNN